ncbi:hypothetical protein SmJEL517_g04882 [Synchytrium microbalum]|uniref:NADP-dependent oxidoreductase domain-containing protein n=1 Tax=Synchytrium microbalum TaxID=1806994 RepID=A0A507BRZ1_9FUNG|nr:uncharacterized protein SmJEL517_g04882 [Synchytrium microbalum]TPX31867.1 hypothetical protein SmJEL517_g04882 [Synchytrium microbalum]
MTVMTSNAVTTTKLGGKDGPVVNRLGFGAMGMSDFYGSFDDKENLDVLHRVVETGCTFIDTADMYGAGENEKLLAKLLKEPGMRQKIFLCTKFAIVRNDDGTRSISGKPEYVKSACAASLQRLGVDYIDLYYQHRVDQETPIEDTMKALKSLVEEGKIKYIGLSECSGNTLRKAYAIHPVAAVQVEYSPWTLDIETNGLLDACRELGVSIVAYSPLGRGFLTGRFKTLDDFEPTDFRRYSPDSKARTSKRSNLEIVKKIEELAEKKKCTPSALVLAWVLAQGEDFIVIPGTKRMKYLEENVKALDVSITSEDDKAIRDIIDSIGVAGLRYPEAMMGTVNV